MTPPRRSVATTAAARGAQCAFATFVLIAVPSCGGGAEDAVLRSPDGRYRVVHVAEAQWKEDRARIEMTSALERFPDLDLVYAHNDDMAHGAWIAAQQKGRSGIRFVGVDALPQVGLAYLGQGQLDATVQYPTCASAAIDLALLLCQRVEFALPDDRRLQLGTKVFRAGHPEGEPVTAPGDLALAAIRRQHAEQLTTTPATDQIFRIGMAQCTDDEPWRQAMREDMRLWAQRYPQVAFEYRAADDDTDQQRGIVRDFVAQGFHAIIVSPKESLALAAPCKEALAAGIPVVVVDRDLGTDDFSVFVGGDNVAIGRAAGQVIRELLPQGGAIVEIRGLMTSSPAQERHRGFAQVLGLEPAK